jgi:rhodanese-related sulfurtransferase
MRAVVFQSLALVLAALLPAAASALFHPHRPGWDAQAFCRKAVWVDARATKEFQKGHLPGALPLNEDEWDSQLVTVLETWQPGRPILVYGKQCYDSEAVARRLKKMDLKPVYDLKGGWASWQKEQP